MQNEKSPTSEQDPQIEGGDKTTTTNRLFMCAALIMGGELDRRMNEMFGQVPA